MHEPADRRRARAAHPPGAAPDRDRREKASAGVRGAAAPGTKGRWSGAFLDLFLQVHTIHVPLHKCTATRDRDRAGPRCREGLAETTRRACFHAGPPSPHTSSAGSAVRVWPRSGGEGSTSQRKWGAWQSPLPRPGGPGDPRGAPRPDADLSPVFMRISRSPFNPRPEAQPPGPTSAEGGTLGASTVPLCLFVPGCARSVLEACIKWTRSADGAAL